jgi:ubiquinol-cytochrome c reductase cytochrome b subunit
MKILRAAWRWLDERADLKGRLGPLLDHPVPPGTGWSYVLGSATLACLLLQVATGIALATLYVPSAGQAYESLEYITQQAFLGSLLRGLHYFGASAMILLMGAHMIRVFLSGSFKFPRELNWLSGVILLGLTVSMGFTGQILRWDEDGVWGMVVAAEQAGRVPVVGHLLARFLMAGEHVGAATLSHIFTYHVFLIPALLLGLVGFHLYLVIRNGISEPPVPGRPVDPETYRGRYEALLREKGAPFFPDTAWRDVVFGVLVIATIVAMAWFLGPKALGQPPDPSVINAEPRPDWYLLWYFAVLALLPHGTEKYLIWILPATAGLVLLGLPFLFPRGERHLKRRPWAWLSVAAILIGIGVFTRLGLESPWSPDFSAEPLPPEVVGSTNPIVVRGADLFHARACEYCHAVSGHGGARGPDLTHVGDDLPVSEIKEWIANGGGNMPAFAEVLDTEDMNALAAFLASRTRTGREAQRGEGERAGTGARQ